MPPSLGDLLAGGDDLQVRGDPSVGISDVAYSSTEVTRGALFFCVKGSTSDGHDFAADAIGRGAAALVVEHWLDVDVPQVLVPRVRVAMGPISSLFFGNPASQMEVVGVTGTNGKTTTTFLVESILQAAGVSPGLIGTTGIRIAGRQLASEHTTPEAPDLHRLLRRMLDAGVSGVAMEVSSHGLDQHRVGGVRFSCAVFTNLSQDHLDYHVTLEDYFQAKARLFTREMAEKAVVNHDSAEGRRLAKGDLPTITYGLGEGADVTATAVAATPSGISFEVAGVRVESRLRGMFNVENCLAAFATARCLGIEDAYSAQGIAAVEGVPGRFEPVDEGQDFAVLVDYAHTPDGVENVLRAARSLAARRLIVVLGCGGDRDRGKRPLMGRGATSLADLAIITSDNPRSEDPAAIIADIEAGAREGGGSFEIEPDRHQAIRLALTSAGPGDVVVIAGKGHETGQEFADRTIPFDDRVVAREELRARRGRGT